MSFFIDDKKRRKSPIALVAFITAIFFMVVFGLLYGLLAEPLYHTIFFTSEIMTTLTHSLIIAVVGTAVCCLLFFLPDKRIVPYSFLCMAIVLIMCYGAAFLLEEGMRGDMYIMISLFGIAPVAIGNAASWAIYGELRRRNPSMNKKKTIEQELKEAIEKENAKKERKNRESVTKEPAEAAAGCTHGNDGRIQEGIISDAEPAGGEERPVPPPIRRFEQEAAMFYMDDEEDDDC